MKYTDADLRHRQSYMDAHGGSLAGYVPLPRPPKRRNLESEMQRGLIKWWAQSCRDFGVPECLLFSVPNGGGGGKMRGHFLKMEGARSGAPDLVLAVARSFRNGDEQCPDGYCPALFLELKTPTGRVQPEQVAFHAALRSQGYRVEIVRTLQEGIDLITTYLTK